MDQVVTSMQHAAKNWPKRKLLSSQLDDHLDDSMMRRSYDFEFTSAPVDAPVDEKGRTVGPSESEDCTRNPYS
jgi:hypothetical protein